MPTKFVPQLDLSCFTVNLIEKNMWRALIKLEVSIDSITSKWTALVLMKVNSTDHHLLLASPPRVWCEVTIHGPNTSTSKKEKGGSKLKRSVGKSVIVCDPPQRLRQVTHKWVILLIHCFPTRIQVPADLKTSSVKWYPWCWPFHGLVFSTNWWPDVAETWWEGSFLHFQGLSGTIIPRP